MQKLGMQKSMNFMNNLGHHVRGINNRSQDLHIPTIVHSTNEIHALRQDESDSQLNRCRQQLQEIQRQQLCKYHQEGIVTQQVGQKYVAQKEGQGCFQLISTDNDQCQCKEEIIVEQNYQNEEGKLLMSESQQIVTQIYIPQSINNSAQAPINISSPRTTLIVSQSKQLITSSSKRPIQELNEQQVHRITDNLELIFDIFKEKIPHHDQIEIIKFLYVKYIGPEEQKNQKQKKIDALQKKKLQDVGKITNGKMENHIDKVSLSFASSQNTIQMDNLIKQQQVTQKHQTQVMNTTNIDTMNFIKIPNNGNYVQKLQTSKPQKQLINSIQQKRLYTKRDKESNQRYFDQQNVANLFIKHGYGLHVARKYLGENMYNFSFIISRVNNHYTNLITTIIRQTWRRIEDYISRIQKINPMNTNDFKVIKTSLVNCVKWMDSTDLQTFYGFLKVTYNLSNNQPYEEEAIRLYNSCIQRYKELRGEFDAQMRVKMEKKFAHQIKSDAIFPPPRMKQTLQIGLTKGNKASSKGPSEHQLGDLIGLIKSQLKQTNKIPNNMNPQQRQPIINPPQIMKPPQPPSLNLQRFSNNFVNGQRR